MIKIKYVGAKKDGERAFMQDTGIEWHPGDEHEVSEENAGKMLVHPDVFVQVGSKPVKLAEAPVLKGVAADQDEVDDEAIAREAKAKKDAQDAHAEHAAKPKPEVHAKPAAKQAKAKPAAKKAAHKAKK